MRTRGCLKELQDVYTGEKIGDEAYGFNIRGLLLD